ncbi:MAG: zinc ribbon domain-containing protein [Proteobacteria bacterium]|nr:zinc ribbon domain-containing protein [Pseudomonadota bacterium]
MALYSYKCQECGKEMDKVFPMNDCPREVRCIHCRGVAKKILSIGHGGVQTDNDVKWLPSACKTLQTSEERRKKPLTTRTEWRECLKKKGLIPIG